MEFPPQHRGLAYVTLVAAARAWPKRKRNLGRVGFRAYAARAIGHEIHLEKRNRTHIWGRVEGKQAWCLRPVSFSDLGERMHGDRFEVDQPNGLR